MRRRAALLVLVLAVVATSVVQAHYPMLLVSAPFVRPGDEVRVELTIGHPYVNDRFAVDPPGRVRVYPPRGPAMDVTAQVTTASCAYEGAELPTYRLAFVPRKPGDYTFSWELRMFTEPPSRRVIDYAKVVVHVGDAQIGWAREPVGTPLEIVPLTRPYAIRPGDTFRGQVLEGGRPMLGGIVEGETYTEALPDPMPELAVYRRAERTDPSGAFAMTLDRPGWWLLSVATDGGPGEQGTLPHPAHRAVLWVYVGVP